MKRLDVIWPLPKSTVRSCSIVHTRCCYVLIDALFPGLLWSSSGSATGCLYLVVSRQWIIVLPSIGMTETGQSTRSYSQEKIFGAASSQYVCAGYPICERQTAHFPEHVSVATLQKVFFSLCEGSRCCTRCHGGPDAGIIRPSAVLQWDGLAAEQTVQLSYLNHATDILCRTALSAPLSESNMSPK